MADDTAKSTSVASAAENGTISRGKYTFVSSPALPTTLFADPFTDEANSCQGRRPVSANSGYGTPSDGRCAIRPNTIVNAVIVIAGWMTAQPRPIAVCL